MSLETIETSPKVEDFTPLSEYISQTPTSFFPAGIKPVLHLHAPSSTLKLPSDQYTAQPDFQQLSNDSTPAVNSNGKVQIEGIDVWVTSRHVLLFAKETGKGVRIEYPSITVTAQDGEDVLLEVNLSERDTADEDVLFVQVRILAREVQHGAAAAATAQTEGGGEVNGTAATSDAVSSSTALFQAISNCQELNPDPPEFGEDGEGEGFDETAPGATGWITSENMGDFMDENGEFRMPAEGMTVIGGEEEDGTEGLGEGAGRTRTADEFDAEDGAGEGDGKWQRTG